MEYKSPPTRAIDDNAAGAVQAVKTGPTIVSLPDCAAAATRGSKKALRPKPVPIAPEVAATMPAMEAKAPTRR